MRKFFFMVFCMVALLLPESLWAQTIKTSAPSIVISSDGTTLTINSTAAGDLATFMNNVGESGHVTTAQKTSMSASTIKTLVFEGTFNGSDLQAVKYDNSSFPIEPTTVDMSEAQFVRTKNNNTPSSYMWFRDTPPTGSAGSEVHAFAQGQLFQLTYPREWISSTPYSEEQKSGATLYNTTTDRDADKTGTIGRWAKVPKYVYRQMTITNDQSWSKLGANLGNNDVVREEVDWLATDANLSDVTKLSQYQHNDIISVREYYKVVKKNESGDDSKDNLQWSGIVFPTAEELNAEGVTVHIAEWVGAVYGNLVINDYTNLGDYICFHVYYRKNDTRNWGEAQTSEPEGTVINADFQDSERSNYMRYANGVWVRMVGFDYFQLALDNSNTESRTWTEITNVSKVDNAKYHFSAINSEDANTAKNSGNDGDYAIVGGAEWVFTGSSWVTIGDWASITEISDYSVMSFKYWKSSLTTAKTSRFANESIDGDIFQECKSITHIDFLGGNVKGLNDRTTGENAYAEFTVTIGKDVTKISQAAFSQSPALTGVEFGGYAEGDAQTMVYPKDLVIEDQAFKYCRNLTSITIPNRCTNIGDYAFQEVGNGTQTDINNARNNYDTNRKFELKFERRRKKDDETVAIDCDRALNIGISAFLDCWYLKELSLPIRLDSLGKDCFKNTIGLHEIIMREETKADYTPPFGHDLLRTIPVGAFHGSAVQELKIPKCVTLIEDGAFGDTENLIRVTFQDNNENPVKPLVIKTGAFTGGDEQNRPQLDVYVMINPLDVTNPGRKVICEYRAFNFTQTVGQTNTATSSAYLHFPEEAWDYYQGNWKRGLAFRQDNLNAFKDGYMNDETTIKCVGKSNGTINTETGKYETGSNTTQFAPANGWQEFARTNTNIDIDIPRGNFMRTYSTKVAYAIPVFANDDNTYDIKAGEPMFKIYRISAFNDGYDPNTDDYQSASQAGNASRVATATEIEDKVGNTRYLPVNTGLLMVGKINANYLVYLAEAPDGADVTYPYRRPGDNVNNANLLYPACIDELRYNGTFLNGSEDDIAADEEGQPYLGTYNNASYVFLNPSSPYPYYGNHPSYRFFAFNATKNQFARFKANGRAARDKAFLKLPYDMFRWANECGEGSGNTGSTTGVDKPIEQNEEQQSAPIMLSFYDMGGELTDVRTIDFNTFQEIKNDAYYTLQGVKISGRPTQQGIYIHNGKKVVIK